MDGDADVAGGINTGIDGDRYYDPKHPVSGHPLNIYSECRGQCNSHADVMRCLVRSVGIDGSVVYVWGGCSDAYICFYRYRLWWGPSFRVLKPEHDDAEQDPHFTFHAETCVDGTYYDPSYGSTGLMDLDEKAPAHFGFPAASRRTGSSLPGNAHYVDWTCRH